MYCPKCGVQNDDNASVCVSCGYVLNNNSNINNNGVNTNATTNQYSNQSSNNQMTGSVPSYLAFSILTTLFCCLPTGIVGIVYSSQVDSKLRNGDMNGAMDSSKKAKIWCWVSFGVGIAWILLCILFVFGVFGALGYSLYEMGY